MTLKSTRGTRAVLITVAIFFLLVALGPSVSQSSSFLKHGGVLVASGSTDPIATGIWQQDQYDSFILQQSQALGLNPFMIKGQIMVESDFNTYAVSVVLNTACDDTHDLGLTQVNPYCSQTGDANLFDPATNIYYGTSELEMAYNQLGSMVLAFQAYNIGVKQVENGQRNWVYYDEILNYAQLYEQEHCQNYGCSTRTSSITTSATSSTTMSSSSSTSTAIASNTSSLVTSQTSQSTCSSSAPLRRFRELAQNAEIAQGGLTYPTAIRPDPALANLGSPSLSQAPRVGFSLTKLSPLFAVGALVMMITGNLFISARRRSVIK
jgi:Transglycosylase SLT domain